MKLQRLGMFGPSESGKTTLAIHTSREYWNKYKIRTLVLDIIGKDEWGPQAMVFQDEDKFHQTIWSAKNCLIIMDEGTETIARNTDLINMFTRMRHNDHHLIVIGHSGTSLLPVMRQQLTAVYIFRQSKPASKVWIEEFARDSIEQCTNLDQYEFLYVPRFTEPIKMKLKL